MAEAAKPKVLDGPMKAFLAALWMPVYDHLGEECFYRAFIEVLNKSEYFPDISLIRRAAGLSAEISDPVTHDAREAFEKVIQAMRKHQGPGLKPIIGKVIRDRDDDGRMLDVCDWVRAPTVPAPTFDQITESALASLGIGDRRAGLTLLARHPALPWNEPQQPPPPSDNPFTHKLGRDIESQFIQAYREARKQIQ